MSNPELEVDPSAEFGIKEVLPVYLLQSSRQADPGRPNPIDPNLPLQEHLEELAKELGAKKDLYNLDFERAAAAAIREIEDLDGLNQTDETK